MRLPALTLIALAAVACGRRSLQADGGGGSIGLDGGTTFDAVIPIGDALCGATTYRLEYLPAHILLVVDRSVDRARWDELVAALADLTSSRDMEFWWGLKLFPEDGPACGDGTVTNKIDVPFAERNAARVNAALAAASPTGNGTPTAAAVAAGFAHLRAVGTANAGYMMLVTGGAPTCAGTTGVLTDNAVQAQADAVYTLSTATLSGFPTFVMGVGVTAPADVDALNGLAIAGGYAHMPPAINFYPSTAVEALRAALTPQIDRSCIFPMPTPPPGGGSPRITINGLVIPYDETRLNGWAYADTIGATFAFHGSACDLIFQTWEPEVQVTFLCLLL